MIGEIDYCRLEPVFYEHTDTNFTKFFALLINGGKFISKSKKREYMLSPKKFGTQFYDFFKHIFYSASWQTYFFARLINAADNYHIAVGEFTLIDSCNLFTVLNIYFSIPTYEVKECLPYSSKAVAVSSLVI